MPLHWNPSKLAFAENEGEFRVSVSPWLRTLVPDMSLAYLAGYKKLNKRSCPGRLPCATSTWAASPSPT
jgi:hypothetical protein